MKSQNSRYVKVAIYLTSLLVFCAIAFHNSQADLHIESTFVVLKYSDPEATSEGGLAKTFPRVGVYFGRVLPFETIPGRVLL